MEISTINKTCSTCRNRTDNGGCYDPDINIAIIRPISENELKGIREFGCFGYREKWYDADDRTL